MRKRKTESKLNTEVHKMAGIPISDADYAAFQSNWGTQQSTIVTNLEDGKFYRLRRSACGGGCRCDANAREIPSLNFTGKILVGYFGKDLTTVESGVVDTFTAGVDVEIHDDLQPDHPDYTTYPLTFSVANAPVYEVIENGKSVGFQIELDPEPKRRAVKEFHQRIEADSAAKPAEAIAK